MIEGTVEKGSTVYTDQHRGYIGLKKKNHFSSCCKLLKRFKKEEMGT